MKIRMPSKYVLLGTSLALMLQTNYRFVEPVGVGELLAVAFIFLILAHRAQSDCTMIISRPDTLTLQFLGVVCVVVVPMTLWSTAMNVQGANVRDLFSYIFVCAILLVLPKSRRDMIAMIVAFLIVTYATIIMQYLAGSSAAYYFSRFTGGAKNPNQLGLFLVATIVLAMYLTNLWIRVCVFSLATFFGIVAMSDAFVAAVFAASVTAVMLRFFPPRAVLYFLPVLFLMIYVTFLDSGLIDYLGALWAQADEGGVRTDLYLSAIHAWSDSIFSILFGYGAGSFSGLDGPFQGSEAHNTALDLATVAGIFGLFLFPLIPLWMMKESLLMNSRIVPAALAALIVFALFHFVGRQPVFWVTLVVVVRMLNELPKASIRTSRKQ